MARLLIAVILTAAVLGCGGGTKDGETPVRPVDSPTAGQWLSWGTEAQTIAALVGRMYTSQGVTRDALTGHLEQTRTLLADIENADPSEPPVLDALDSLHEMEDALQFVLEFSRNQGSPDLSGIRFRSLEDAVNHLGASADALVEASGEGG